MKAVIQRVKKAAVSFDTERQEIGEGLVVFVGIAKTDTEKEAQWLANKIINLRIFPDKEGKFDKSVLDINGELLAVSQFTLLGDCKKGRRPDFTASAEPALAKPLYDKFVEYLKAAPIAIKTGKFQEKMLVEIYNDGPVTIIIET